MELLFSDTISTENLKVDYYVEAGFDNSLAKAQQAYDSYYRTGQTGYEAPAYVGLCRVDFDTIIQVPETFYIGITSSTPINTSQDTMLVITFFYERHYLEVGGNARSESYLPYEARRYRIAQSNGEEILNWADEECHYGVQTCLYPILVLPCTEVTGLRCQAVGSAGTVTAVTVPRFVHTLDRNTHYDFYVRARCDLDTTMWSAWSEPLHVHLATLGDEGAEAVDWSLTPNPAHGNATVRCEEGITEVELLDMKGETLLRREAAGEQACTLDLTGLAKGIYIVQITTPQGTAARKLAVE